MPVKKSITNDYIICLEDGKQFKSLKRHLRTQYNLSPDAYREKWGLPPDYPMVAPTTPRRGRTSPSRWASASSGAVATSKPPRLTFANARTDVRAFVLGRGQENYPLTRKITLISLASPLLLEFSRCTKWI